MAEVGGEAARDRGGGVIHDLLRSAPQTKRVLAERAGTTSREVELAINALRLAGWPILSDSDGYRLSQDPQEVLACSQRLRRRAVNQYRTARALRSTARRMTAPQIELWSVAA